MQIELHIEGKDKIFTVPFIKSRMLRNALSIKNKMDFANIKEEELDELIAFVCDVFNGQFTVDELYDGLPIEKLMPTITDVMNSASGQKTGGHKDSAEDDSKKK